MLDWRLIYDFPTDGITNMAVDEALLKSVSAGSSPPVLRLYGWLPACLSLGYGQRASDVDFERLAARGWGAVRRPTGGRAILHADELTYSLALPASHPLAAGDVVTSYRRISQALLLALQHLGIQPQAERQTAQKGANGAVCFETPSHYEITFNGRKLIGSAQVRRQGGMLQHGTLPLSGDIARICEVLTYPDEASREAARIQVRQRAVTLSEALSKDLTWEEVAGAVTAGFRQTFNVYLQPDVLTPHEQADALHLAASRYGDPAFTLRKRC